MKNILFKISKTYLILFLVTIVVRFVFVFLDIRSSILDNLSFIFIAIPYILPLAVIIYWFTRPSLEEQGVSIGVAQKSLLFWQKILYFSGFIILCSVILIILIMITASDEEKTGGQNFVIAYYIVPMAILALYFFIHSLFETFRYKKFTHSSAFQPSSVASADALQTTDAKELVAKYKKSLISEGRQTVGVRTSSQLVIVASAVLVVGGIIAFGVVSYFGSATGEKDVPNGGSESKSSVVATGDDGETIKNLKMVQDLVVQYYKKAGYLPSIAGHLSLVSQEIPYDYDTSGQDSTIAGIRYHFRGDNKFELCANFKDSNTSTLTEEDAPWEHGAGSVCFERDIAALVSPSSAEKLETKKNERR